MTCANFAKQYTARDNVEKGPQASRAAFTRLTYFYLDDYLNSFLKSNDAIKKNEDLVILRILAGFHFTIFSNNYFAIKKVSNPFIGVSTKTKDIASGSVLLISVPLASESKYGSESPVVKRRVNCELQPYVTQRTVLGFV